MTEISFRFNVPDRLGYALRYLRKAVRAGRPAVATGPSAVLVQIDQALWRNPPTEFVPHVLLRAGAKPAPLLAETPLWLAEDVNTAPGHDILVNLGDEPPAGFERFARLVEIVSVDPAERDAARRRWRHYQSRGYPIEQMDAAGEAP